MSTLQPPQIHGGVAHLRAGDVVAFPTETVYGLGADARNEAAVLKIFSLKGRPADHPLIVHVADMGMAEQWAAELNQTARILMDRFWPGPLTLVLPARDQVSRVVTGGQDSVALRAPRHPLAQALIAGVGGGLAAPSANPFGRVSPTEAGHVRDYFPELPVLDGGPCHYGLESTIVSLLGESPQVLRPGALPIATLRRALGDMTIDSPGAGTVSTRVPGALASHYAPATRLEIVSPDQVLHRAERLLAEGLQVAVLRRNHGSWPSRLPLHGFLLPDSPRDFARQLYARLREIDRFGFDRLLVEAPPLDEAWWAINDRLARAAHPQPKEIGQ